MNMTYYRYGKYIINVETTYNYCTCLTFNSDDPIYYFKTHFLNIIHNIKLAKENLTIYGLPIYKICVKNNNNLMINTDHTDNEKNHIIDEYLTSILNDLLNQYEDLL
jgi:hypothetical protein